MLTIGITTHNRLSILKTMAQSLYQSNLSPDCNIRVYDDCSTEYGLDELYKLFPSAESIKINKVNLKADGNTFQMYKDFLKTSDSYFFNADSDLIFRKGWLDLGMALLPKTHGILTLFNATSHKPYGEQGGFLLKKDIGAAGTLFRRDRVEELVRYIESQRNSKSIDWQFSKYFCEHKIPICCVKESLVQHIGYTGQNSFYCFDYGKNFTIESVEQGRIINDIMEFYTEELYRLESERLDNLAYHLKRVFVIMVKKVLSASMYSHIREKLKTKPPILPPLAHPRRFYSEIPKAQSQLFRPSPEMGTTSPK